MPYPILQRYRQLVAAYSAWVVSHPKRVLVSCLLGIGLLAMGAGGLGFTNDTRVMIGPEHPQIQALDELQDEYAPGDYLLFVLAPENGQVFSRDALEAVSALTQRAWQMPYAGRVDSVTNFPHTRASADSLEVSELAPEPSSMSTSELKAAEAVALNEPLLANRLISADASHTGISVSLVLPSGDNQAASKVVAAARALRDEIEQAYPAISVYLTGGTMIDVAFGEATMTTLKNHVPLMIVLTFLMQLFLLRSFSGASALFFMVGCSSATAMGLAGYFGVELTAVTAMAPITVMTLAVADGVHLMNGAMSRMRDGTLQAGALAETLQVKFTPLFLTSFTTALGLLSLNASDSPPLREYGNIVASGVIFAWILSITLLPALASLLPLNPSRDVRSPLDRLTTWLGDVVISHGRLILVSVVLLGLVLAAVIPRNKINDNWVEWFDPSIEFRAATDYTAEHLTGIYIVEFSLDTDTPGAVSTPTYLAKLEAFENWLRKQAGVIQVNTLVPTMKRLNRSMHADDPAFYSLPASGELAAQYLLLYELSLPVGRDLTAEINLDKSGSRVTVTMENMDSDSLRAFAERAEAWLRQQAPEMANRAVSPPLLFSDISNRNFQSMSISTLIALAVISVVLVLTLGSLRLGIISLVPNFIPPIMAFGAWALLVGEINFALSVVMGMMFGIIVDDTIHFLSAYRDAQKLGLSAREAVRHALDSVGSAMIMTSLVLLTGFITTAQSGFLANQTVGYMCSLFVLFALLTDLLLLPALLIQLESSRPLITSLKSRITRCCEG